MTPPRADAALAGSYARATGLAAYSATSVLQLALCGTVAAGAEVPSFRRNGASLARYDHRSAIESHKSRFCSSLSACLRHCASWARQCCKLTTTPPPVKQHQFTERFLSESQARRSDDSAVRQHMNNLLQSASALPQTPSRAAIPDCSPRAYSGSSLSCLARVARTLKRSADACAVG